MGYSTYLHIGPYVEVHVPLANVRKDTCRNKEECPSDGTVSGFCQKCGLDLSKRFSFSNKHSPSLWHVLEDYEDRLVGFVQNWGKTPEGREICVLFGNQHYLDRKCEWDLSYGDDQLRLNPGEFPQVLECHALEKFYKAEMEALRKAYGEEHVLVKWGIVTYRY